MRITRESVLELAGSLWAERDNLSVDEVDGAFYWTLCRGELRETLETLLAQANQLEGDAQQEVHSRIQEMRARGASGDEIRDAIADLPWTTHHRALLDHLFQMEQEIPGFPDRLDRPPLMRSPLFTWQAGPSLSVPNIQPGHSNQASGIWAFLGIRDSRWRGEDVERELRTEMARAEASQREFIDRNDRAKFFPGEVLIFLDFKFYDAGDLNLRAKFDDILGDGRRWLTVDSPVVVCTSAYPLPPEGLIAEAYESTVIRRNQWDARLYGAGVTRNQTVPVAIRTWTIGLLVGVGMRWADATRDVLRITGSEIAQAGFHADRDNLIARVPEAEAFVFQRRRRTI